MEILTESDTKELPSSSLTFKAVGPLSDKMLDAHSDLMLEPILAYVELNLKNETSSMSMNAPVDKNQKSVERLKITARRDHMNSVLGFFEWLRDIKGVKRIVKLVVSDDQDLPCSDEVIEQCLHGFDIRYLDWNRDDICSMSLKAEAPFLREVWLSWSGRNSSLLGWSNPDCGLRKLGLVCSLVLPFS